VRKKQPLPALKRKLWMLFSKWIRERDKYTCITCGNPGNHAGHYIEKSISNPLGYFSEVGVNCQCVRCNLYQSGTKDKYALALERIHGFGILQLLEEERKKVFKPTREWYEKKIKFYGGGK